MIDEHEPSEGQYTIAIKKERNVFINRIQADAMNRICK